MCCLYQNLDFLEVCIDDAVVIGLLLVGCTGIGARLCACGLLCGSSCLIHLLEDVAQSVLLCLDVVDGAGLHSGLQSWDFP